jgi:hypothetical protein
VVTKAVIACPFSLFLLAIAFFDLLQLTASDYLFVIFNLSSVELK